MPKALRGLLWLADRPLQALTLLVGLGLVVGATVHQAWFWGWYIEDAAISFAYARNWAEGEGLVAIPGGERLEGYSNATWVALLALFELLGIDGFRSSKGVQLVLVGLTLPLTWMLAREASPEPDSGVPLVATGFLATSTTMAIWGASGLENALFSFLLAAALLRSALDIRQETLPWASLLWMLLAITRPEAILYCAVAGFLTMLFTLHRGVVPTLQWLLAFFVPFLAYHAVRFGYFAWEFPQTYYGKMTTKKPDVFAWNRRGWKYVRNWSHTLWTGYYLPIYLLGLSGSRGWRFGVTVVLGAALGARILLPDLLPEGPIEVGSLAIDLWLKPEHFPKGWEGGRAAVLAAVVLTGPLLGVGASRGWQARLLCWGQVGAVGFFAVYTLGDWMKAWRWMSLLQVPLAVLFATGMGTLVELVERTVAALERHVPRGLADLAFWAMLQATCVGAAALFGHRYAWGMPTLVATVVGAMGAALLLGIASRRELGSWGAAGYGVGFLGLLVTLLPNMDHLKDQRKRPETGPFAIRERVEYVLDIKKTLDITRPLVDLDVDQGGHLWWGRGELKMHDTAGLVDIPFAQHRFETAFVREYVFDEVQPDFVHLHGGWANSSRIPTMEEWRQRYYEIPGYPAGARQIHIGNHVRRDLFMKPDVPRRPERRVVLDESWILEDVGFPSEPATGRRGWLRLAVRRTDHGNNLPLPVVQVTLSQRGELARVWTLPLAFDWLEPNAWRRDDVFVGGFPVDLEEVPPGTYDLGFSLVDPLGPRVLPPVPGAELPDGALRPEPAVFLPGEVVFPAAVEVVSLDRLSELAREDRQTAIGHAKRGRCERAERAWDLSRWHRTHDRRYLEQHEPTVAANLAICWAMRASRQEDPHQAVPMLERASDWQHDSPTYLEVRGPIGEALDREGEQAWAEGDWPRAFRAYRDAVLADPIRSWSRRWAEKARERVLHTRTKKKPVPKPEEGDE